MRISDWSSDVCSSDMSEQNTLDPDIIEEAAIALRTAAEKRSPIPQLRESLSGGGVAAASAVQELNTRHALSSGRRLVRRSEEHASEPQSLMRTSYAVFCMKKNKKS